MRPGEGTVASAASALQALEVEQLSQTALALPDSWILEIVAPYGQLSITPRDEAQLHTRCWVVDGSRRVCSRVPWQPAL